MCHVKPRFSFHHLKFDPPFLPLSCQKWGRSLTPVRIPWTQKTSKVEEGENRPGLSTSTPFSPAVASTSSSTTTREEDLMNTRGVGETGGGEEISLWWSLPQNLCFSLDKICWLLETLIFNTVKNCHKNKGPYCGGWVNLPLWLDKMKSCVNAWRFLRNGKVVDESSRCGTFGVSTLITHFFLCAILWTFYQETLYFFYAVAPGWTLQSRTLSVLVSARSILFNDLSIFDHVNPPLR